MPETLILLIAAVRLIAALALKPRQAGKTASAGKLTLDVECNATPALLELAKIRMELERIRRLAEMSGAPIHVAVI